MPRHGMGTASPGYMEQTEDYGKHTDCTGAQRATSESRASLTRVHSHTLARTNTTAHLSACRVQAVT